VFRKNRLLLKYQFGWISIECKADRAGKQTSKETAMTEAIAELEKRRDLLKEINALVPDEETMAALAAYVENVKALEGLEGPDEEYMKAVADHHDTLKAIEAADFPSDEEIEKAAEHYATLKAIENAA
jgi:hypothetical protein